MTTMVTKIDSSNTFKLQLYEQLKIEHLIAGVSGGVISTIILHPLDVIKIRFACNDGIQHKTPQYTGIMHAFKTIHHQEGIKGLYRGIVPNVWGAGSSWGLYFLFYNAIKTWQQNGNENQRLGPGYHLLSATQAGIMTLLITNPIWVVKTRLCLQYDVKTQQYHGMVDTLIKLWRANGIRGYYKGLLPGLIGVSHGAIQFMVYEELKNFYNNYHNLPISTKLDNTGYLCFAAISKLCAVSITYPYQVVRARLQNQHHHYHGIVDCIRMIWHYENWRGFYKGLGTNLLRVTPATMITFVTYENISRLCSR